MTDMIGTKEAPTAPSPEQAKPAPDTNTRFTDISEKVGAKVAAVTTGFEELQGTAGSVDLGPEGKGLFWLKKEQIALTAETAKELGRAPLVAIAQLMEQPAPKRLAKTESAIKTTRYLEREGRQWQDGIQVLLYNDDAVSSNRAEINNFALEIDAKGQIIERRTLNIKTDGTAELVVMKKQKGRWVGETMPASESDVTAAVDAMKSLQMVNTPQPQEGNDADTPPPPAPGSELSSVASSTVTASAGGEPPVPPENTGLEQEENPERQGQIRLFAIDFLLRLNPEIKRDEIMQRLFSDGKDIFDGPPEKDKTRLENLRYLDDVYKLAKHYEQNDEIVPQRTVVVGNEPHEGPFDDQVLVFVDGSYTAFHRPVDDAFVFERGEGKKRPHVYLKNISDTTVPENSTWQRLKTRAKMKRVNKKSFSISGAESVIVGGEIQPTIPHVEISCFGDVTLLQDAELLAAPSQWRTNIEVKAGRNIVVSEGSTLSASSLSCDTFVYQGELLNPHKDSKRERL